jgi:hypothetical protein
MFARMKVLLSAFGLFWRYKDTIQTITNAWSSFPGADDSQALRAWVRPLLVEASVLAAMTPTPIDDLIAHAAVKLVDNNNPWTAIHALVLFGRDSGWVIGVRIPQAEQEDMTRDAFNTVLDEIPESPSIILAALGVLLYILQQRRGKK